MKKSRLQELKNKDLKELIIIAKDIREKLSKLRFDLKAGKTDAVKDIRKLKKELAIVLTLQNQTKKQHGKEE